MPRDPRAWLADIVAACDLLIEFTAGKTFTDYAADPLVRSAVERQFEIAGEGCALPCNTDRSWPLASPMRARSSRSETSSLTPTAPSITRRSGVSWNGESRSSERKSRVS